MALGARLRRDAAAVDLGSRRAGHALLIHPRGELNAQALAFAEGLPDDPDHQVVVLDLPPEPADGTWPVVARLLGRGTSDGYRLVMGRTPPGGTVPVGQWLADRLDRAVVVPDGVVVPAAGGVLYIPADRGPGWVRLLPRRSPTPLSRRFPKPAWEFTVSDQAWRTSGRTVVDPLPSGVWLHGDGHDGALSPHRNVLVSRLAYRPDLLTVVLGCPGGDALPLDDVSRFWHSLLPGVRDLVRFVPYGPLAVPDGTGPGQALADRLDVPVTFDNGLPVSHAAGDAPDVHALDADGSPGWAVFARQLRFAPARLTGGRPTAPVVVGHRSAFGDLPETAPGRYRYDGAVLEVVPSGLWLRPAGEGEEGEEGEEPGASGASRASGPVFEDDEEAAAIRSAAPSARHVNVVFGTSRHGGGRMRELAERLLQRLDPALRAMARLVPAVQLARETGPREPATGPARAGDAGPARIGDESFAPVGDAGIGRGPEPTADAYGTEGPAGATPGPAADAYGADAEASAAMGASARSGAPGDARAPGGTGPRLRLATAAPSFGDVPAGRGAGAAVTGAVSAQAVGAGELVLSGERRPAVPDGMAGPGPDVPGGPAGAVTAPQAEPYGGERGLQPSAGPSGHGGGLHLPAGPSGDGRGHLPAGPPEGPASGLPAALPEEHADPAPGEVPSGRDAPAGPGSGGAPSPGGAPAGPGSGGAPSPGGAPAAGVPDGSPPPGRSSRPLPSAPPLPSLRLVSSPGLPAPGPVPASPSVDGAAPGDPGTGRPDAGADAQQPAGPVPQSQADPVSQSSAGSVPPAQVALVPPSQAGSVPQSSAGSVPQSAAVPVPDADGRARAGAVPPAPGGGTGGSTGRAPDATQAVAGGRALPGAAAGARVQAVPSPAACAVPPRDGVAREREWLRGAFRQQYNDGAGAVARLLSEVPGLRGTAQTPTEDVLTDLVAARLYLRGDSALLDRQVRAATVGPHIPLARCVAAGVRRLPSYRGATVLRAALGGAEWDWYRHRTLVTEWAFCWALTAAAPELPGDTDILIWSMTARRTALLAPDQPARVLFLPGTTFKVLAVRDGDRRAVLLRELSASEISADGRVDTGRTALDDMALSGLEQADRSWQAAEPGTASGFTPEQAVRFTAPPGLVLPPPPAPPPPPGKRTAP
ncbi:hypothetical protein [Streptomyces cinerochromogenes]|uniref:hypothetical protein n=1 Tax=Streptomyces cinerochromogenes TaxID=66422 RepID=UPI00167078AA|nr:hypothetical protein [Streptomyces cinerochromogenes]GGS99408.1 hypothetical protein GCM10010206_72600 [Streptomyces cinerochromogenes]